MPAAVRTTADAEHLYTLLEEQVVPLYYKRDARGLPIEWLQKMKQALRIAGESFDARRMVAGIRRTSTTYPRRGRPPSTAPPAE